MCCFATGIFPTAPQSTVASTNTGEHTQDRRLFLLDIILRTRERSVNSVVILMTMSTAVQ